MESLMKHLLRWECSVFPADGETVKSLYERAAKKGVTHIKNDLGGATLCGITLRTYTDWCRLKGYPKPTETRLAAMDFDTWKRILNDLFWTRCKASEIRNGSIALMLVDWCWVNGPQAIRDAQTALGCVADGIVGPKTLAALNDSDSAGVFTRLKAARERSYRRIVERRESQRRFLTGWLNRTDSIDFKS